METTPTVAGAAGRKINYNSNKINPDRTKE